MKSRVKAICRQSCGSFTVLSKKITHMWSYYSWVWIWGRTSHM